MNRNNLTLNIGDIVLLKQYPQIFIEKKLAIKTTKSYSHKPYLADMPYDRNSRHPLKMCARYIALGKYEEKLKSDIKDIDKEFADAIKDYDKSKKELVEANTKFKEVDETIQKEKEDLSELAIDRLFMDGGVALYDDAFDQFSDEDEDDWVSNWDTSPSYQYFENEWVKPLDEILSFTEKTGYCDEAHSQMIDDYIAKLESLDISTDGVDVNDPTQWYRGGYRLKTGINMLKQIQSNDKFDSAKSGLDEAKRNLTDSRKNISNIKRRSHERNVALYEVANEKLNCSDVFDEAQLNGSNSNPLPNIEEYSNMINIYPHLNRDGTVDETFLQNWEKRTVEYTRE